MKPERAAERFEDARKTVLAAMPDKAHAMAQAELFDKAGVIAETTGRKGPAELLAEGQIQRIGKSSMRQAYRYFRRA